MEEKKRTTRRKEKPMEQDVNLLKKVHDVFYLVHEDKVKGMSVRQASEALDVSERTIFRMLDDGRLKAKKVYLPDGKYVWDIDTLSIARILVRGEVKDEVWEEMKKQSKAKKGDKK